MSIVEKIKFNLMHKSRKKKLDFFYTTVCMNSWPKILDVGVADLEHSPFDNFLEKNCPYPERITVLSIYPLEQFRKRYPAVTPVVYNGGRFPFEDNTFDILHCNAVIEHVGDFKKQVEFVREIARVSRKFFFTTPSRFFPFETHTNMPFLHYLPKKQFDSVLTVIGKEWATGDYMNLLSKNDLDAIVRQAGVHKFRIITKRMMGLPLHYFVIGEKE